MMHAMSSALYPLLASTKLSELFTSPLTDPVAVFTLLMATILFVPLLSRLLRIPDVVGLIIAGMILGPTGINLLTNDPGTAVELLAKVGLIYIMFQAGLEIDMNGFEKNRSHSVIFGVLSYAVPIVLGSIAIYVLLHNQIADVIQKPGDLWPAIILLASVFASHTLLSYPIVTRLGILTDPAVTTALGGTIVTDTMTLLTLAIIAAVVQGDVDAIFWAKLVGFMTLYFGFVMTVIPRVSRWFLRNLESDGPAQYVYILAVVFFCALLAIVAGMEDIIGAFFAGLAVNRLIPHRSSLANRIDFVGASVFIPMFLLSVGMIVDIRSVADPTMWSVAAVIIGAVFVTKCIAVFGSGKLFGYNFAQTMVLFGLTTSQAAATLAATFVGYRLNLFDESILNSVIMLILGTCIVSPWMTERWGRIVAREAEAATADPSKAPQRLAIPLANPNTTESLMKIAVLLHDPKSTEPLYPMTVAMDGDNVDAHVAQGEKNLESAVRLATEADRPVSPVTRVDLNVADGIMRALTELRIRSVLIGWNGHISAEHRIFGTVLDRLLEGTEQTIFVYRHAVAAIDHKRVILAIPPFATRQPGFSSAVSEIWTLCQQLGVQLHVITPRDGRSAIEKVFSRIKPSVSAHWIDIPTWDNMLPELQSQTNSKSDLIILMAARAGSIAWGPDLDRLPRQLSLRFPGNSFMVVYPGNPGTNEQRAMAARPMPTLRRLINMGGAPLTVDALDGDSAIDAIVEKLPENQQSEGLAKLLKKSVRSNSVRVTQGTVLIDAQDPNRARSSIVVASAENDPILFDNLPEPVRHIWVLLTGRDVNESDHDTLFSSVSQRLRQVDPNDLKEVHTTDDVMRVLDV